MFTSVLSLREGKRLGMFHIRKERGLFKGKFSRTRKGRFCWNI